jgi:hypothetical protein
MVYSQASIICVASFSIICPLYMVVFHFISYLLPDIRIRDWIDGTIGIQRLSPPSGLF